MQIEFKMDGGMAYLPGLSKPASINSDDLPASEAAELERLVDAAHFFDLPAARRSLPKAADYRQYTISITESKRQHTVRLSDPIQDANVQALVNCLKRLVQEQRAQQRKNTTEN